VGRLTEITASSGIILERDAARLIAKMADGALRAAISLLDQCISLGKPVIAYNDVLAVVGIVTDTFIAALADSILGRDVSYILASVDRLVADGKDIAHFISDLVHYFRILLVCKVTSEPEEILDLSAEVIDVMKGQCKKISQEEITYIIKELSTLESGLKWVTNPRIMLEVTLVKLCENKTVKIDGSILERLEALENRLDSGMIQAPVRQNEKAEVKQASANTIEARKPVKAVELKTPSPIQAAKTDYMPEWQKVLDELKSMGRRALHSFLIDTKAVRLSENLVGVVFKESNKFNKTIVAKAEHIEVLQETAGKVLGAEVKIKYLDEEAPGREQIKSTCEPKDEFVEKARGIAEKAGIPLEIFDE
ncbi:MAG: DNA polymerase III subunit gamma/tau, partial [Ruminiclostridium sp.]|nr:DNA polymerase III subunit gamma/tau [Ruminiclostridium sp.]